MAHAIRRLVKTDDVDLISSHDLYGAVAAILAGQRRICLLTLHSIYSTDRFVMEERVSAVSSQKKAILKVLFVIDSLIEVLCYNLVRGILCVSKNELHDTMRKTLCKTKVFLIRNAVDTNRISPSPEKRKELRGRYHFQDEVVFLYAGRMVPKNGPFTIVQTIPYVAKRFGASRFIFVGEGPERPCCQDYTKHAKVANIVSFLGAQDAVEILPIADVFVSRVSSLVKDIGLDVLEALATGLPVIIGEDDTTSQILKCGDEVMCARKDDPRNLAECMIALATDHRRRQALSVAGRKKVVKDFSLIVRTNQVERLYQAVAEM